MINFDKIKVIIPFQFNNESISKARMRVMVSRNVNNIDNEMF